MHYLNRTSTNALHCIGPVQGFKTDRQVLCQAHEEKEKSLKLQLICAEELAEKALYCVREQHAEQVWIGSLTDADHTWKYIV